MEVFEPPYQPRPDDIKQSDMSAPDLRLSEWLSRRACGKHIAL
jgi:hypothetical protein